MLGVLRLGRQVRPFVAIGFDVIQFVVAIVVVNVTPPFAEYIKPSVESLPKLKWHSAKDSQAPASKPDGDKIYVVLHNQSGQPVKVFWMDRQGQPKPFGTLEAGWRKPYSTRPGAIWLITDTNDKPFGHFVVGDRGAQAIIPAP